MKLGVDLGGTKIEVLVLDQYETVLWRKREPTPAEDYRAILNAIVSLVTSAKQTLGIAQSAAIGVGTPGALIIAEDGQKVMKNCNSTVLNGQPLPKDLAELLCCPVYIANDANCMALAEALSGQGRKLFDSTKPESVFGVILGTGVGAGVVVHSKIIQGLHSITGEWGHNQLSAESLDHLPLQEKNRICYCGRSDCIETYLSGPGLAQSYSLRFKHQLRPEQIIQNMHAGEQQAKDVWGQYLDQFANSLANVVNILDPALIVLGGGLSQVDDIYMSIHSRMVKNVFTSSFKTPIVPALLGDSAGVFGAAWLCE